MENEPPEHTRLRRPVAARLQPRPRRAAAAAGAASWPPTLLDEVDPDGFDVDRGVRRAAAGAGDRRAARRADARRARRCGDWSQAIVRMYEPAPVARRWSTRPCRAATDFAGLVRELVGRARGRPGRRPDHRPGRPTELTDDEVVAAVVLLLNAGHEASVNVFGNGLVAMLRRGLRPGADVAADRRGDAALRLRAAAVRAHRDRGRSRSAASRSSEGQRIAALLGRGQPRPGGVRRRRTTFDVDRDPNPHLAFGVGRALLPRRAAGADGAGRVAGALFDAASPTWRWRASRRAGARSCCAGSVGCRSEAVARRRH